MNLSLKDSVADALDADKRKEWSQVESEFQSLKSQMVKVPGINSSQDTSDLNEKFAQDAENPYLECQKWMLGELKIAAAAASVKSAVDVSCKTKREAVQFPLFKGFEKDSPFLKFTT